MIGVEADGSTPPLVTFELIAPEPVPTPPTVIYVPIPTQAGTPTQVATAPQPPVTLDVTGLVLTPATTVGHRRRTTTRAKLVFVASALNLPDTGQATWRGPATGQGC